MGTYRCPLDAVSTHPTGSGTGDAGTYPAGRGGLAHWQKRSFYPRSCSVPRIAPSNAFETCYLSALPCPRVLYSVVYEPQACVPENVLFVMLCRHCN